MFLKALHHFSYHALHSHNMTAATLHENCWIKSLCLRTCNGL